MKTIGLGGATASLMMLLEMGSTTANELQSNQQLLIQRLDQLAAAGQQPGAGALFSLEPNLAASQPVVGGAFPSSILIPGSNTSLKIYGRVSETAVYYTSGGNPNGSPQNTTVGVNGQAQAAPLNNSGVAKARSNGIFLQSPRSSRLGFETRTPTALGEMRTVMEFDWAGSNGVVPGGTGPTGVSDNLIPRLRYAYGTLDGFLVGQATSNFSDPDAFGEILEFGGNVGEAGRTRVPQIRYTMPVVFGGSFSISAETPETLIATGAGIEGSDAGVIPTLTTSCTVSSLATPTICTTTLLGSGVTPLNIAKGSAPDLTAAWYLPQPWGHLDISAVVRPGLAVTDGRFFAKNFVGYGGHFSADVKPGWFGWAKDDFIVQFTTGGMLGAFLSSSSNFDLATNYGLTGAYGSFNGPATAATAAAIVVKPTQEMGGELGYQHWWLANLRSNINAGFNAHYGIPIKLVGVTQAASINKELITAHVNLIWNPVSSVTIGIEYMWGRRTVLNNVTGGVNALISHFRVSF